MRSCRLIQGAPGQVHDAGHIVGVMVVLGLPHLPAIGVLHAADRKCGLGDLTQTPDLSAAVGEDVECNAEIIGPLDLAAVAIPGAPVAGIGILPSLVDEIPRSADSKSRTVFSQVKRKHISDLKRVTKLLYLREEHSNGD